jgi:hypothetical protein
LLLIITSDGQEEFIMLRRSPNLCILREAPCGL